MYEKCNQYNDKCVRNVFFFAILFLKVYFLKV